MFWIENAYAKVWKIDSKEKYDDLRISTAEKDSREEGKYINSNWFARAIGKAHNQIANGEIAEESRVKVVKGKVSNESYKDNDGNTRSSLRVTILEFESADNSGAAPAQTEKKAVTKTSKKSKKSEPEVTEIADEDLPF